MLENINSSFETRNENSNISKGTRASLITEIREKKKGFINPVIVTFQNGEVNEKRASELDVTFTSNDNGVTNVELKTPYGHVFKDPCHGEKPRPKQIIAIRNKKTNKVKLVEVDSAVLINSALIHSPTTDPIIVDPQKEVKALQKTFGGKRIVNRLEQKEKLNLSSLPISDDVKKAVKDIEVDENISVNSTETESIMNLLPPCHRDAEALCDVYIMNEILSEEELDSLKNEVQKLDEIKFDPDTYSPFFRHYYPEVKNSSDGNRATNLAGILFVECLINFLKMPTKKLGSKTAVFCQFSKAIHEKLLNEFCHKTETSVTRPLTMRDKSLCYIIAVCLISCEYQINLKLLSTTTSTHLSRLTRLARVVGAVPVLKDEHVFVLKLPLPALPKSAKGKIKRK